MVQKPNTGFLGVKTIQKSVTYWSTHAFDIQANLAIIPSATNNLLFQLFSILYMHKHVKNFETFLKIRQELKTSSGYYYRRPMYISALGNRPSEMVQIQKHYLHVCLQL